MFFSNRVKKAKVEISIFKQIEGLLNPEKSAVINIENISDNDESVKIVKKSRRTNKTVNDDQVTSAHSKNCVIKVYRGGSYDGYQVEQFSEALNEIFSSSVDKYTNTSVDFLSVSQVKQYKWTEKEFVDWLLASTVHFIIAHPHQGYGFGNWDKQGKTIKWDLTVLYRELERLSDHKGFPRLSKLRCPIFTQDKFEYLRVLQEKGMANPSLRIPVFSVNDNFLDFKDAIAEYEINTANHNIIKLYKTNIFTMLLFSFRFCAIHCTENSGWKVKTPYTCNSQPAPKQCGSVDEIIAAMVLRNWKQCNGEIPYFIVQESVQNTMVIILLLYIDYYRL